jgi:hypothetical protein
VGPDAATNACFRVPALERLAQPKHGLEERLDPTAQSVETIEIATEETHDGGRVVRLPETIGVGAGHADTAAEDSRIGVGSSDVDPSGQAIGSATPEVVLPLPLDDGQFPLAEVSEQAEGDTASQGGWPGCSSPERTRRLLLGSGRQRADGPARAGRGTRTGVVPRMGMVARTFGPQP